MMKMKTPLYVAALLSLGVVSQAAFAQQPTLSFVELGYGQTKIEDVFSKDRFSGLNLSASFELTEDWYLPINYFKHSADDTTTFSQSYLDGIGNVIQEEFNEKFEVDYSEVSIGVGYMFKLDDSSMVTADISYLKFEVEIENTINVLRTSSSSEPDATFTDRFSASESDDGLSSRLMYRKRVNDAFQFNAGLHLKVARINSETESNSSVIAEGLYHINENFALKLAASLGDDDAMIGSVRYSF
jgi:hypothetical protein